MHIRKVLVGERNDRLKWFFIWAEIFLRFDIFSNRTIIWFWVIPQIFKFLQKYLNFTRRNNRIYLNRKITWRGGFFFVFLGFFDLVVDSSIEGIFANKLGLFIPSLITSRAESCNSRIWSISGFAFVELKETEENLILGNKISDFKKKNAFLGNLCSLEVEKWVRPAQSDFFLFQLTNFAF